MRQRVFHESALQLCVLAELLIATDPTANSRTNPAVFSLFSPSATSQHRSVQLNVSEFLFHLHVASSRRPRMQNYPNFEETYSEFSRDRCRLMPMCLWNSRFIRTLAILPVENQSPPQ